MDLLYRIQIRLSVEIRPLFPASFHTQRRLVSNTAAQRQLYRCNGRYLSIHPKYSANVFFFNCLLFYYVIARLGFFESGQNTQFQRLRVSEKQIRHCHQTSGYPRDGRFNIQLSRFQRPQCRLGRKNFTIFSRRQRLPTRL